MVPGDSANKGILRYTISDVSMAASGNYRLQVTSLYGCIGMDSFKLVVKPRPSADFSLSSSICEKAPLTFVGSASIQSPDSIISYSWNFGNGESAAIVNPTRSYINSGNYLVSYTATASNGCVSDSIIKTIESSKRFCSFTFIYIRICYFLSFVACINNSFT